MTPTFMGGEPIITTTGKYKGNIIFQDEQNVGLRFMQSLTKAQQTKATISTNKKRGNLKTGARKDSITLDYEGLPVAEMTPKQKSSLLELIGLYVHNMRDGHAKVKMSEVKTHIDSTYFAWVGAIDDEAVFYYRIHSPVLLIEFDHQSPVVIRTGDRSPTRNHIHTMVRTPNGNDYGKDYLHQHLQEHSH